MLDVKQIAAFSDELQKIAQIKVAILPAQVTAQTTTDAPPPIALGSIKPTTVKKNLSTSAPTYSKVHSVPVQSPAAGVQPVSDPPSVRS